LRGEGRLKIVRISQIWLVSGRTEGLDWGCLDAWRLGMKSIPVLVLVLVLLLLNPGVAILIETLRAIRPLKLLKARYRIVSHDLSVFSNFGKAGIKSLVVTNRKIVGFPRGKLRKQIRICVIVKSCMEYEV
jgi:hypothetical protein